MRFNTQYILSLPTQHRLRVDDLLLLESDINFRLLVLFGGMYRLCTHRGECIQSVEAGLYLIPQGEMCSLQSLSEDLQVLSISFRAHPNLCNGACPSKHKASPSAHKSQLNLEGEVLLKSRPRRSRPTISYLVLNDALRLWADSLLCLLSFEEVEDRHFDIKLEEFFALLRLAYPLVEADIFLKYYHCRIEGFRSRIYAAYRADMEVSDLYALGGEMALSEMAFKRSFIEEFAVSPRAWLVEQRAKAIYRELITTDKPLKELSYEFGFCSVSHFGVFCKQALGDTPLHIRKGAKSTK